MWATELPKYFEGIGARLEVTGELRRRFGPPLRLGTPDPNGPQIMRQAARPYTLDIGHDDHGEHFTMHVTQDAPDFRILQARRDERHLLLYAAGPRNGTSQGAERLLCGHDERHWFVSAVGEPVSTVMAARRALLPKELRHKGLNKTTITSRHNHVFRRQGEWFFVPVTDRKLLVALDALPVHREEPIQRGIRNKAHRCEFLVRTGGTTVRLAGGKEYSNAEWHDIDPNVKALLGRVEERMKDMVVYVRGRIRHPDHATITLDGWHNVFLNGEIVSSSVVFYD